MIRRSTDPLRARERLTGDRKHVTCEKGAARLSPSYAHMAIACLDVEVPTAGRMRIPLLPDPGPTGNIGHIGSIDRYPTQSSHPRYTC
jgi:hypothetical protein